jgi:excisionase family DNA binding protein
MQKSITSDEKKLTNIHEPLMDVDDVAAYLKVSRSWVYQHAASGKLPSRKIGGTRRFVPSEIREWTLTK